MQGVKGLIVLSAVVAAVALGACRREEPAPLKLGAICLPPRSPLAKSRRQGQDNIGENAMKSAIVLAVVVAAVALGACRREEPAPLKLGADLPTAGANSLTVQPTQQFRRL